ncbi:2-oxoglutarate receptor 1-like [Gadus chalcogrammus]|uniref:2-oxoglutarate receptor 1-like n=1 Tax=Gadus chalcogrammus TaxID=1042646 RepID=UPI0024C34A04|nr:2-oxoglutarate receptor 1-like [Gadus chalcogrammus]
MQFAPTPVPTMLCPLLQDPNNATVCSDDKTLLKDYFLSAAYSLLFAVGLAGNLTAIVVYVTMLRPWKTSAVIMVNLALADLLHMLTLPFLVQYYKDGETWKSGAYMCYLVRFAFFLNLYSSVLLLTCLAAFRWLVVARPLCAAQVQRRSWGLAACAAAWAAAIALVGPMLYILSAGYKKDGNGTICVDFASQRSWCVGWYSRVLTALGFLLPLATVAACYAGIVRELAKGPYKASPRRVRARRLPLAILAGFVVCFLPYHVLRELRVETVLATEDWTCKARSGIHVAYIISRPLAAANTLCNLGLNTLAGGRFQRAIWRIVGAGRRCLNGAPLGLVGGTDQKLATHNRRTHVVNAAVRCPSRGRNEADREAANVNNPWVDVGKKTRM